MAKGQLSPPEGFPGAQGQEQVSPSAAAVIGSICGRPVAADHTASMRSATASATLACSRAPRRMP